MAPAKDLAAGYAGLSDDEDEGEEAVLATPSGTGLPSRGSGVFNGGAQDMAQQSLDDLAALFQTAFNELRNPHLANPVEVARKLRERVKSGASTCACALASRGRKGRRHHARWALRSCAHPARFLAFACSGSPCSSQ